MKLGFGRIALLLLLQLTPAQAAPTAGEAVRVQARTFPPTIEVRKRAGGFYYVNSRGLTLYALNQRIAFTRSAGGPVYCIGPCAKLWIEAAAPPEAKPVGDWSVLPGLTGPQWAYKKNPVFTFAADKAPGQTRGDKTEDLWNVIAYVPPAPSLAAPPVVTPLYANGAYVLADHDSHALFVSRGKGSRPRTCTDWTPLLAGLSARDVGGWTVDRTGPQARWRYLGRDVFISPLDEPAAVPDGGQVLRP